MGASPQRPQTSTPLRRQFCNNVASDGADRRLAPCAWNTKDASSHYLQHLIEPSTGAMPHLVPPHQPATQQFPAATTNYLRELLLHAPDAPTSWLLPPSTTATATDGALRSDARRKMLARCFASGGAAPPTLRTKTTPTSLRTCSTSALRTLPVAAFLPRGEMRPRFHGCPPF